MNPLDLLDLIPDDIKNQARDELVDFVSDQAKKYLGDETAGKIKKLRSDAAFNQKFEKGLQRALERFVAEYEAEDEDLVAVIVQDPKFFENDEVKATLMQIIKNPGGYIDEEREMVLQSFVSILPERRNRQRVDRAISYLLKCLAQEVWNLPELQPIYSLQFQRQTAEATRQQVELQKAQLLALTEMNAGIKDALLQLTSAMEQKLLAGPTISPLPHPRPFHNLPRPDYNKFIGREVELTWLSQRLSPKDRAWQIAITGIGGVGKSALALAVAHEYQDNYDRLPAEERFDAIIWTSAKEDVLTVQGRERARLPEMVLRTLQDVYTAIAHALEREDITRALPEDQGWIVEKALKEQRTLLIMDNLESVKDERIKPFLRNLPAPTKTIITSREWLDVADVWHLKGLSSEEADSLIWEEATVRQVNLESDQRHRIYTLTSGLPLPIKLAIARIAGGESFNAVTRWLGDAEGDLPEYCIRSQAELVKQRNPNAWSLLLACSLFDRMAGASRDALGYIVDLSISDRDVGLTQLQRMFLLNRGNSDRFWVLPIVQRYANMSIEKGNADNNIVNRWINWLSIYVSQKGLELSFRLESMKEFGQEYPNILQAIRWCHDHKLYEHLLNLCDDTWEYPNFMGLHHEFKEIVDYAKNAAGVIGDEKRLGHVQFQHARLAWLTRHQDPNLLSYLDEVEKIAQKYDDGYYLYLIWGMRSQVYIDQRRLADAEQVAVMMLKESENADDYRVCMSLKFTGMFRLFYINSVRRNLAEATEWLNKFENLAKEHNASRKLVTAIYAKGLHAFLVGDLATAEQDLTRALKINSEFSEIPFVARDEYYLAQIYAKIGNWQLARQYAKDARDLFIRLGMADDAEEMQELFESL